MSTSNTPNRLAKEKSPYLLQHAYNPVDWYPWGEEAFAKAREEGKPIFLSIGYSTCHWCHVMEHESFENEEIAALLNALWVSIKVDREERPDVDRVYMSALQAMGQGGGWPMSMFLTPALKPFYGGTYFPPDNRYGRAGFPEVLRKLHNIWASEPEKASEAAERIMGYLQEVAKAPGGGAIDRVGVAVRCYEQFVGSYDEEWGGFGGPPKFPRPVVAQFLTRFFRRTGEPHARIMAAFTLRKMAQGGMYDHVGGGFHRYAVDGEWRIPHFEKMLYDQAQLVRVLLDVHQLTQDHFFADVARDTLAYVLQDLSTEEGGFASAEDADSPRPERPVESGEGAFYVWQKREIEEILGDDAPAFCYHYGVEEGGNAPYDPQHEFTGRNILFAAHNHGETARAFRMDAAATSRLLRTARERLRGVRAKRPRPLRDDKVLVSWNGLMISACARAAAVLDGREYLAAAKRSAGFIMSRLYDARSKTLLRRWRDGEANHEAHLEDYAFFTQGLIDLYEVTGEVDWLEHAVDLTNSQIDQFWDNVHGGFFDTAGRDSSILVRTKEAYDGAEPSGNAVAALNLLRLASMTGKSEWHEKAESTIAAFAPWLEKEPSILPAMVSAAEFSLRPPAQVVITGPVDHPLTLALRRVVFEEFLPFAVLLLAGEREERKRLTALTPYVGSLGSAGGAPAAYVCENFTCRLPVHSVEDLRAQLRSLTKA
jgi:uncharacterized protein